MTRLLKILLLFSAALAVLPGHAGDLIELQNAATEEVGALVDGSRGSLRVNDARYLKLNLGGFFDAAFPVIPLDEIEFDATRNEIIAFARRRPPVLVPDVPWTPFSDRVDVAFDDELRIPIQIWIVQGPFGDQRLRAAEASLATGMAWLNERTGIAFSTVEITDATTDPDVEPFLDFNCTNDGQAIKTLIGYVPDRLNIYYVNRVDFGTGPSSSRGVRCSTSKIIAMGRNTDGMLLAHELGHGLSLIHPVGSAADGLVDTTNIMHNLSSVREFLTEGQNFRAVYNPSSALNEIYDVRAGRPTRGCSQHYRDDIANCPAIQKRVWADGASWPPN
jgi:hypothetical protein